MIGTILIVDDDFDNRELMQDLLTSINFAHVTASTGLEAIELAQAHTPDVILMDMSLGGGMNGLEVAQRLRQMPELNSVLIIGVTADVFRFSEQIVMSGGCDLYLAKPFSFKKLRQILFDIRDGNIPTP